MSGGNDKLERELESFLADDSRVASLYRRLPKDEPDAKLDAAILAEARAAVAPRRARARWLPAMSAAAAIVLAAGLAYRVGPQVWSERSAVSETSEQRVAAPASAPAEPSKNMAPMPQAETSAASSLRTETVSGNTISKQDLDRAQDAEADKLQTQKRKFEDRKSAAGAVAKQATPEQPRMESESARDNASAATRERQERKTSPTEPPRIDAPPVPPAESVPAMPATLAVPAKPVSAPQSTPFPATAGGAAQAPAAPPPAASAARAASRESAQTAPDIESALYPEHWIADIQKMLKDGHRDRALRNLNAFRKQYPGYKLPDDLRDLK